MGHNDAAKLDRMDQASRTFFEQALVDDGYYGLLLEDEERVVAGGGVVVARWPGSPRNYLPKRGWILNMYVEPDCRRRGYAAQVLRGLIAWCREQDFEMVALHASQFGRGLYEKFGFVPTSEMRLTF